MCHEVLNITIFDNVSQIKSGHPFRKKIVHISSDPEL